MKMVTLKGSFLHLSFESLVSPTWTSRKEERKFRNVNKIEKNNNLPEPGTSLKADLQLLWLLV